MLDRAELGLTTVWAEPAMLERDVKGSYIVDLPNPGRFLSEGDLVLTSAIWATGPESAETYISALADKRVAVLVVGTIIVGAIPDYIVAACSTRGIVLLTMSQDVSFKAVSQYIESTLATAESAATSRSGNFTRTLLDGIGSGGGVQGALRLFYDEFATECWVLESSGTVSAVVGSAPGVDGVAAVWNRMLAAGDGVAVIQDDAGRTLSVWPVVTDSVRSIGYLVCAGDLRAWPTDLERVVRTLLLVVRVELELVGNRREAEEAQGVEFLGHLVADTLSPGEASARLRLLGADPLQPMTAVAAQVDDGEYPSRAVLEALTGLLGAEGRVVVACDLGEEAVLLLGGVEATPEEIIAHAEAGAHRQRALLGDRTLRIGVSERTTSLSQLSAAVRSARARMRTASGEGAILWSTRSTPSSYDALFDLLPERVKTAFGRGLLAPLLDYDVRHGSDLVQTLRVFLDASGAWQQAATELHVHVNTLRYRIGRIEALTQRDLSTMRDRVDFFLALSFVAPPAD
nr:PucR family transcriptional regulator [Conyzicola lurida]